jgi:D-alanyl-D-alanine endopeptidase (penicillin-binding protein 7)
MPEEPILTQPTMVEHQSLQKDEVIQLEMQKFNLPVLFKRNSSLLVVSTFAVIFIVGASVTFSYFNTAAMQAANQKSQAAAAETAAAAALPDAFAAVHLIAQSSYVYDLTTHQVLFTMNADAIRPLASLTKIPMALAVSEVLPLDSNITIPYDTATPGSAEILTQGSVWPVHDVLSFTLIASSNQGADILSAAANDSIHAKYPQSPSDGPDTATIWRMNIIAQSLGLTSMHFDNDNGLDITTAQSGGYGSARDVGTLIAYAASTSLHVFAGTTHNVMTFTNARGDKATAYNTDTALGAIPGIVMGKTGYTDLAGGNLAVIFDTGLGHPIAAVVLGSTEDGRFTDMKQLVAAANVAVSQGQ